MIELDKLLNDLSKRPTSFKSIKESLYGVHLSDDMIVETDETMVLIDYKFKRFIMKESEMPSTWIIDVDVKNQDGGILDYKVKNQKVLQQKMFELLIKISDVDGVLRKINS
ncbi:hypothetical protein [Marinirhabdus gelatinilytica]|uniref:Uncharacterized protein n=1 Tax=Marinirhabdus gelatinilytica TaxID=1703343 RepID=A0A370QF31_9FLAO|nr:hypothetical protein [Marinirhabdus gelatinilytica]RDK86973.1 hypothetical protein C8D94_102151 [Marinirhabdus gelatinilytica]